eukprot:scaffold92640_cov22-Tisochrysis_lutea.AAC.1
MPIDLALSGGAVRQWVCPSVACMPSTTFQTCWHSGWWPGCSRTSLGARFHGSMGQHSGHPTSPTSSKDSNTRARPSKGPAPLSWAASAAGAAPEEETAAA